MSQQKADSLNTNIAGSLVYCLQNTAICLMNNFLLTAAGVYCQILLDIYWNICYCFCNQVDFSRVDFGARNLSSGVKFYIPLALTLPYVCFCINLISFTDLFKSYMNYIL